MKRFILPLTVAASLVLAAAPAPAATQSQQIKSLTKLVKKQAKQIKSLSRSVHKAQSTANAAVEGVAFYDACLQVGPFGFDTALQADTQVDFSVPVFAPVMVDVLTANGPDWMVLANPDCVVQPTAAQAKGARKFVR